jgi:hypothetical protein
MGGNELNEVEAFDVTDTRSVEFIWCTVLIHCGGNDIAHTETHLSNNSYVCFIVH